MCKTDNPPKVLSLTTIVTLYLISLSFTIPHFRFYRDRLGIKAKKPANAPFCKFFNSWNGCQNGYGCTSQHIYNGCHNYFGLRRKCPYGKNCQFNHRTEAEVRI